MRKRKKFWLLLIAYLMLPVPRVFGQEICQHEFIAKVVSGTCTEAGYTYDECTHCGFSTHYTGIDPLGHDWGEWEIITAPTCFEAGVACSVCARCGEEAKQETGLMEHNYVNVRVEPGCEAEGYVSATCSVCGKADTYEPMAALGHDYGAGSVQKEPTLTAMGRIAYTCSRCGNQYTDTIPKWTDPFVDINKKGYSYNGILWAYNNGITTGITDDRFDPEGSCTRGQVVTFLWRQAGKPEPKDDTGSFKDVEKTAYYYDAVQWAVEQGITKGITATEFAPNRICTRAEVVTFLHRAKGCPQGEGEAAFSDVKLNAWYAEAVAWALEYEITTGTGLTTFSPTATCSRAQIVTFLYRARWL